MNSYKCFYGAKEPIVVGAESSYQAQLQAAWIFKAKKSYDVSVVLLAKGDMPYLVPVAQVAG